MHRRTNSEVIVPRMANICKDCGCACQTCFSNGSSLDLHQQIEELQCQLLRSNSHISLIEHELIDSKQLAEYEVLKLREEFARLRDRYDRLLESHKRMQKVNHDLEDKLLKVVNKFEGEKVSLQREVAALTSKLVDGKVTICELEEENERYRNDCNLAVQLLHCRPSNFVAHKLNSLPMDLQDRVKKHMTREQILNMENSVKESKLIRVPMQTFPPCAMVYSVNNTDAESNMGNVSPTETVPMSLIAKVLTQPEPRRKPQRTYICLKCKRDVVLIDKQVQATGLRDLERNSLPMRVHRTGSTSSNGSGRPRHNSTETEI
ncbi:tight junction-associated protein 1-like [Haliotis asinina]|uniref:tight junction-associated protein 1-like n=1 Tax=Haliotis asinina TaxID=109174 RepID=UPI003532708A